MTLVQGVKRLIETEIAQNRKKFIIFPFGDIGMQINTILTELYNIKPEYILDNHLCNYNPNIKPLSFLKEINCNDYVVFLASMNMKIYDELKESLKVYMSEDNIIELRGIVFAMPVFTTTIGKYSYGPICRNHDLIESIGSFCSFAFGVDAVPNHEMRYITTHPILYAGKQKEGVEFLYVGGGKTERRSCFIL